ncbi:hypothetical protein KGF54_000371 [Candida jiufengensis]|uniref:uncharacterized protein n=1 Tax=Candida jiufengensis TaxID=497108 RepID=UPI0022244EF7|nr:uncharacterized protein KGF54_000371 [Candida jiufengensis]KAI5956754.1 hypothetical protein KGF54_000371 [Candida jiufengensis]
MNKYQLIRRLPKSGLYSTISFTPNENKHVFESEKMTREENYAAIPNKPTFTNIEKVHHEILNPEDVADLVTKLNTNDVLISILSRNKNLYGNSNYVIKSLAKSRNEPTIFPFASILTSWKNIYNQQIKQLTDLEEPVSVKNASKSNTSIGDMTFEKFFDQSKAIRNSKLVKGGTIHFSEIGSLYTVESASNDALGSIDNVTSFEKYLKFISLNLHYFRIDGLKELLGKVSQVNKEYPTIGNLINELVITINASQPSLLNSLDDNTKDNLAYALSGVNFELSKSLLKSLIDSAKCPNEETISKFIGFYTYQNPDQALKDLSFLKSVFFHRPLTTQYFRLLLSTITDKNEIIKFITLLKNSPIILEENQMELYNKLKELSRSKLLASQFLRLLTKQNIKIDSTLLELVKKDYEN